jgi:hypothetical protein
MKENPKFAKLRQTKKFKQFERLLINGIYRQFLEEGIVDPHGKSDDQIIKEVLSHMLKWSKERPMMISTDHRPDLLKQARAFAKQEDFEKAILFYATWFEHWINGLLTRRLKNLDEDGRRQMLRETSLNGKFKWLLPILYGVEISIGHLATIVQIAERRNSYVHYKFILVDVDGPRDDEKKTLEMIKRAERTIEYLRRFEAKLLLSIRAREVIKKLKSSPN